ncbi:MULTISPECIES: ATP-binding cassette domain-containing protein [unclassified Rathayibacter]|uniref:ATP-binding cassette domain-containing protein n=1 Tax=unclassified Rathayibacter TaxID=2609250 RepID=UPI00188B355E|nr:MULTISPECIES: ATP-binding cassette domain-containing protein [unclassified Rathayibacter]MBF4462074.1 ATP-binding cassette domain-containing protein [Rathayibacter sp. VKM Ac-2879]MBF4503883.1 ATP-binding cassette domain-containing protein [Rathayibacter sp. VKM Ac-2878]
MSRTASAAAAVIVDDLSVEYPPHGISRQWSALRGISLRVEPGEVLGILGGSGSGKSTLARVLGGDGLVAASGRNRPVITGGDATVAGHRLRHLPSREVKRFTFDVAFLAQDAGAALRPELTVSELIAEPIFLRDRRYDPRSAAVRVATLLDAVHLPLFLLDRYPYELSSGQRQRVAIARALVLDPIVLIADEPTAGIDATVRESIVDLLADLRRREGFAAVVVSHDIDVLSRATDRIAVLVSGEVVAYGPLLEVLTTSRHPYVRELGAAFAEYERFDASRAQRAAEAEETG